MDRIEAIRDDQARMVEAHRMMKGYQSVESRLSDIRHFAAVSLRKKDRRFWTLDRIAFVLGLTGLSPRNDAQAIVRGRRALRTETKADGNEEG